MSFAPSCRLYDVDCDVGHCCADLATAAALARACVNARRLGARLRIVNASPELRELIALVGVENVLSGRRERQTEEGEEPCGIEKRGEPRDPPA
jgi:hypothetical protein